MIGWRRSPVVAAVGLLLFLVLQLGVPILRMSGSEDIQRFGWQMFSTVGERIEFTVHIDDENLVLQLEDVVARARGDIPFKTLLPPHLCNTIDGAERVTWNEMEYRC